MSAAEVTPEAVWDALRVVEDPELGMDVVDLGLVYDVAITGGTVAVTYSLTSMGCPAGAQIEQDIRDAVGSMAGVGEVTTELIFDPAVVAREDVGRRQVRAGLLSRRSQRFTLFLDGELPILSSVLGVFYGRQTCSSFSVIFAMRPARPWRSTPWCWASSRSPWSSPSAF